jgi:cytochrome c553
LQVITNQGIQVTALVLLCAFVGAAIGNAIAGGIYSDTFRDALRHHLGAGAPDSVVNAVFESITSATIPAEGTPQRKAVNLAYSDVLRNITYAALGTSAICLVIAFFLPNLQLKDGQSLVSSGSAATPERCTETVDEAGAKCHEAEGQMQATKI